MHMIPLRGFLRGRQTAGEAGLVRTRTFQLRRFRATFASSVIACFLCASPVHSICPIAFSTSVSYPAGVAPAAVAAGDANGDGLLDLVIANGGTGSTVVSVLLGNGDGTFQTASNFAAGNRPVGVALGDLNGDGILDVVASNSGLGGNTVSTMLGIGDGSFAFPNSFATAAGPMCPVVVDLNADGKGDVAVAANGGNKVSVLLGNGDGTLASAVHYNVGTFPQSVAAADFNGDGKIDLTACNSGSGDVSVLIGNGDGTFAPPVNYSAGAVARAVQTLDANNDGIFDLVTVNDTAGGTIQLLVGNGDGTFQPASPFMAGSTPVFVAVGDVNGDGHEDVATANFTAGTVSILRANGAAFSPPVNFNVASRAKWISMADFTGDGRVDMAVVDDDGVSVLLNNCMSVGITQHPVNQSRVIGENATFSVMAGGAGPLSYQWRRAGKRLIDGGRISGAKTAAMTIANVTMEDIAAYDVIITGGCNGVIPTISRAAVLCVEPLPPCRGDFNNDSQFDGQDIQGIVDALLAEESCP